MHRCPVTSDQFDVIAAELIDPIRYPANFAIMSGYHRHHGRVVMLRGRRLCMVFVEEPACLDAMLDGTGAEMPIPNDGAVIERAMRANPTH